MTTLASEWTELLARRPSFREALAPLGRVIDAWESWPAGSVQPLLLSADDARRRWSRGEPLLAAATPDIPPDRIEPLLHAALDLIDASEDTRPFAEAWDRGEIMPASLLPRSGRIGAADVAQRSQLSLEAVALLAVAGLRPFLREYFAAAHPLVDPLSWDRGTCPCCGAPPGCAELIEDGRRQLACHLCDARWTFARLMCPFCASRESSDLVRLIAEGADEGYAIAACRACRGCVKEIDRRARWNAGPAIVEDWGSPHLDLIARRQGYWRAVPGLRTSSAPS